MANLHKIVIGKGTALGRAYARVTRARDRIKKYTAVRDDAFMHQERVDAGALILVWERELKEALEALAAATNPQTPFSSLLSAP